MTMRTLIAAGCFSAASLFSAAHAGDAVARVEGASAIPVEAEWGDGNTLWLTTDEDPQAVGLLLPAVQKVREAARRPDAKSARVATAVQTASQVGKHETLALTDGDMDYVLYDVVVTPADGDRRVRVEYRCKDWTNRRTGEEGSDCRGAKGEAAKTGKKGNVEVEWKVEEGEY
ncbi:MAG: hypothetical protein AAFW81_03395 [Pseudomonadota bacterium]